MTAPRQTMLTPRQWRRLLAAGRKYRRPGTYAKTYEQTAMARDRAVEFSWEWAHKRSATYAYYSSDREIARLRRRLLEAAPETKGTTP